MEKKEYRNMLPWFGYGFLGMDFQTVFKLGKEYIIKNNFQKKLSEIGQVWISTKKVWKFSAVKKFANFQNE